MPGKQQTDTLTEVKAANLRPSIPEGSIPASTESAAPLVTIAGQERAREAIAFGLTMPWAGYHIAVSGPSRTGRNSTVKMMLDGVAGNGDAPPDWVYLYNFSDPTRPHAVSLPPGNGRELQQQLRQLIDTCRTTLPAAFESDAYQDRSSRAIQPLSQRHDELFDAVGREADKAGFLVNATPMGPVPVPKAIDGTAMSQETFNGLPEEVRTGIQQRAALIEQHIAAAMREARQLEREMREAVRGVDADLARATAAPVLTDLRRRFASSGLASFFDAVEADLVANVEIYKQFAPTVRDQLPPQLLAVASEEREAFLLRYSANLFVEHEAATHTPVVDERHPTHVNLFGRVDLESRGPSIVTDHLHVRAGALHRANGGYLLLQLADLMADGRCWMKLKQCLKTNEIRVEDASEGLLPLPTVNLTPEGIPLEVKVVLLGDPGLFRLLDAVDTDFAELFKVRAEFEPDFELTPATVANYVGFARQQVDSCGLLHLTGGALTELVCHGARLAERQDRLSAQFGVLGDLCQEANQLARAAGSPTIDATHILGAVDARRRRSGLISERLRRMIAEGTLHIETSGSVVGQVNGLAVYSTGNHAFGTPIRITCRTGPGQHGVLAIERETERSGAIHTKGVLVLSGFLMGVFGRRAPLAFNASLTFEQSYDEVEGDSASSAELYAILTSLSDVAIRQDIAVTGSVDQFGNIQPVGGVPEKVEGFFDLCNTVGLTGSQGVIVPRANLLNLTLRGDVVEAIEGGKFHIWAIERVEQGLEILTGMPTGVVDAGGQYAPDTVFARISTALETMRAAAAPHADSSRSTLPAPSAAKSKS